MKFVLEVTIDGSDQTKATEELGRALRYWAGNLEHYDLTAAGSEKIYDSDYNVIGMRSAEPGR